VPAPLGYQKDAPGYAYYTAEHKPHIDFSNEELKKRLESAPTTNSKVRVIPVGYTKAMDEYMSAADLIVGKPGGLTTCEALAKGLAFVIVNPIPGQEERNSDHLLEQGAAIRSNETIFSS